MVHKFATFRVQDGKLSEAIDIINEFVGKVLSKEDGCLLYRSLQNKDDEQEFIHYMIFEDEEAEEHHQQTDWVETFTDKLYPILEERPEFKSYDVIA